MLINGELDDRIDYAVFADAGQEPESVYRPLAWLRSLGGPPILTDTAGRLGDDLIRTRESSTCIPCSGYKVCDGYIILRRGPVQWCCHSQTQNA